MKLDKTALDRILSLDDASLAKTISALTKAAGIDERSAAAAISNMRLVRQSLSNATDADIEKALSMLGRDRTEAIKKEIGGKE